MHLLRVLLVIAWGICVGLLPSILTAQVTAGPPPRGTPGVRHNITQPGREPQEALVTLRVNALVPENVKLSDPAQGTVRATVLALDTELNQVKVQTHTGQQLTLYLTPASFAGLRVGMSCMLQIAQRALPAASWLAAPEEAFW